MLSFRQPHGHIATPHGHIATERPARPIHKGFHKAQRGADGGRLASWMRMASVQESLCGYHGYVALWVRSYVAMYVAVWLHGYVGVWLWGNMCIISISIHHSRFIYGPILEFDAFLTFLLLESS